MSCMHGMVWYVYAIISFLFFTIVLLLSRAAGTKLNQHGSIATVCSQYSVDILDTHLSCEHCIAAIML
jgi:hypothetical protein